MAVTRHVTRRVAEALEDTRVVVVQGARQVGKTTLLEDIVRVRDGRLVTFDDESTRVAAQLDPVGFLRQTEGLLAIDEIQRVPDMVLALKLVVDRDRRPGRFLVTGSADLLRLPMAQDSLAGRAESIELFGFSQGELAGHRETFLDRVIGGDLFRAHASDLTRNDYVERAVAGAYPEALARPAGRRRQAWLDNYVRRIVERDAPEVSRLQRIQDLPLVLRMLAARNSAEFNAADLSSATGIPTTSLLRLVDLLETLFLVQKVPAWSTNLTKRVVSRPKVSLLDSGLAARLINVTAGGVRPGAYPEAAGGLIEGFVVGELRRQQGWAEEALQISHFRDRAGAEVDVIIEAPDGRVAGLEIKASSRVSASDGKWLAQLRDMLGKRFVGGLVLNTGTNSVPFGDRVAAVPIDVLWTT